jgi:hypothetical protein
MNRAQYRSLKKAQQRNERRSKRAAKRALPRCPVCQNEVSQNDRVPCEGENGVIAILHSACVERLNQAKAIQTAERVKQQGIWLPGDK